MKGRCQRYQRHTLNRILPFSFFGPKHFSSISPFLEDSQVKRRCQRYQRDSLNRMRPFSLFVSKHFSSISSFLEVAQVKGTCQRYQRGSLSSVRPFSFFAPINFFVDISICRGRTGESEGSTVQTWCTE